MKILFIFDYYYPYVGGAEIVHQKLAEHMAANNDVTVLTQALDYPQKEIINNVKVIRVPTSHRLTFPYQAFKKAQELAKNVDLIQASTYASGILAAKLKKYTQAKIILLVHGYLGEFWYACGYPKVLAWLFKLYEKKLFDKTFDHYVAVAEHTKQKLIGRNIPAAQITMIHNGVDTTLFAPQRLNKKLRRELGISESVFLGIFYGRPNIMKGTDYILSALLKLKNEKNLHLLFVLSNKPYQDFEKVVEFIKNHHLQKFVTVIESVPNEKIPEYLAMANIVLIPSLTEECCMNAIEASAMDIPVIASDINGLHEVVSGRAIFIPSKSSEAIVAGLKQAMNNQFETIPPKDFSWQKMLDQYDQLYEKLV